MIPYRFLSLILAERIANSIYTNLKENMTSVSGLSSMQFEGSCLLRPLSASRSDSARLRGHKSGDDHWRCQFVTSKVKRTPILESCNLCLTSDVSDELTLLGDMRG